jgi:hypothetical protein
MDAVDVGGGLKPVVAVGVAECNEVAAKLAANGTDRNEGAGGLGHRQRGQGQGHGGSGAAVRKIHDGGRGNPIRLNAVDDIERSQRQLAVTHDARAVAIGFVNEVVVSGVAVGMLHAKVVSKFVGNGVRVGGIHVGLSGGSAQISNTDSADGSCEVQAVGVAGQDNRWVLRGNRRIRISCDGSKVIAGGVA